MTSGVAERSGYGTGTPIWEDLNDVRESCKTIHHLPHNIERPKNKWPYPDFRWPYTIAPDSDVRTRKPNSFTAKSNSSRVRYQFLRSLSLLATIFH